MNITITGNLGSGKTSVCNVLQGEGFEVIKVGMLFRQIAEERGMTVVELNEMAKTDRSVDDMLDERSARLGKEKDNAVFDSRMAWNFIPDSFKVFLLTNVKESAKRVLADKVRDAEAYRDLREAEEELKHRATLEQERFRELYGVNYFDISNYNLVIETTNASPEDVAREILRNLELYHEKPFVGKVEMNPTSLYPTRKFGELSRERIEQYAEAERKNAAECSVEGVSVMDKGGHVYTIEDYHRVCAAILAEKKFIEVKFDLSAYAGEAVPQWKEEELREFEEFGHFQFADYPDGGNGAGYMIDWA